MTKRDIITQEFLLIFGFGEALGDQQGNNTKSCPKTETKRYENKSAIQILLSKPNSITLTSRSKLVVNG